MCGFCDLTLVLNTLNNDRCNGFILDSACYEKRVNVFFFELAVAVLFTSFTTVFHRCASARVTDVTQIFDFFYP